MFEAYVKVLNIKTIFFLNETCTIMTNLMFHIYLTLK